MSDIPVPSLPDGTPTANSRLMSVQSDDSLVLVPVWSNDPNGPDYVLKNGDTMLGTLTLAGPPVADLDAATKQYVDQAAVAPGTYVEVAGDTMTGALTLSSRDTFLNPTVGRPGLWFVDNSGGADNTQFEVTHSFGIMAFIARDDGGGTQFQPLAFDHAGLADLSGASAVTVPAATAANQAAQVTAVDATNGRLAIGGIEMGDTGWRDVSATNLNTTDWRLSVPYGLAQVRRIGSMVYWRFNVVGVNTSTTLLTGLIPSGFLPWPSSPPQILSLPPVQYSTLPDRAIVDEGYLFGGYTGSARTLRTPASTTDWTYVWNLEYTTEDAWPTSLPGTPA